MKGLLLLFCFVAVSQITSAQQLKVEKCYIASNDLSASKYERKDGNDNPCALIKVLLTSDGAKFEGNIVGDVRYDTGEYWVYLTEGSYELRIKHPLYTAQTINFRDFSIQGVDGKRTYIVRLMMPNLKKQELTVVFTPTDATVLIDNNIYPSRNGVMKEMFPVGKHELTVAKVGYESFEGTISLKDSSPSHIEILLKKKEGSSSNTEESSSDCNQNEQHATPETSDNGVDFYGAKLKYDTIKKKNTLYNGLTIKEVNSGKFKEAGVPIGFQIQRVNDENIYTIEDLKAVTEKASRSKEQVLYIQGLLQNGKKGYYAVSIKD